MAFTSSYTPGLIQQSEYIYGTPDVLLPGNISGTTATFTNVTASANISASGNITTPLINGNGTNQIQLITPNQIDLNPNGSVAIRLADNLVILNNDTTVNGNITASGTVSSSGQGIFNGVLVTDANYDAAGTAKYRVDGYSVLQNSGTTLNIAGNNYWETITYGNEDTDRHSFVGQITASANISASGTVFAEKSLSGAGALPNATFALAGGSTSAINLSMAVSSSVGQVIPGQASGEDISAGQLVYQRSNARWYLADADATSTSINLLGIALNSVSAGNIIDVLIDGVVTILSPYITVLAIGEPLYVDTTAGSITNTAPSGENDVVRIVGHYIKSGTGFSTITFKPDGTWVEL